MEDSTPNNKKITDEASTTNSDESNTKDSKKETVYDEYGVNADWNNPREEKRIKEAGIDIEKGIELANEIAKYWYYNVGVNLVPCVGWVKSFYLMEYKEYWNKPLDEELFKHLLETGAFYYGIAVLCGTIWRGEHKGKWLNVVDWDNLKGQYLILTDNNGVVHNLEEFARHTIIETNKGSPNRGHAYFITPRPLTNKNSDSFEGEDKPRIEIYGQNHVSIAANSPKREKFEGGAIWRTEIIKNDKDESQFTRLPICLNVDQTDALEVRLDLQLAKHGLSYLKKRGGKGGTKNGRSDLTLEDMLADDFIIHKGGNRQGALLRYVDKLLLHLKQIHITVSTDLVRQLALEWNNKHCDPPLDDRKFERKLSESIKFIDLKDGFIEGEEALIKELNQIGINVEYFMDKESLDFAISSLMKAISRHQLRHDKPIEPVSAADKIEEKYDNLLKSFEDTEEVLFFNGKIYEFGGEVVVKKEIESMRKTEHDVIKRLSELGTELGDMILRRDNAGKSTIELANYQHALTEKLYEKQLSHMTVTEHFRKEVVKHIVNRTWVRRKGFTEDISNIVLDNGVLKLRFMPRDDGNEDLSWELIEHSPDILSTTLIPITYNPDAKCDNWIEFLERVTGVNAKARRDLQKMFGYTLLKSQKFKMAFMIVGPQDAGKSVIKHVLDNMFEAEKRSHLTLQSICDGNQFATSALYGKSINTCGDLPKTTIYESANFKMITGDDEMTLEQKGKPHFTDKLLVKLIFLANDIPESKDDGSAWHIRWKLIPVEVTIPKDEQDKNLRQKLSTPEEMSGILNWALEGLKMLLVDGDFEDTGTLLDIKELYKTHSDIVYRFIKKYYEITPSVPAKDGETSQIYAVPHKEVQNCFKGYLKKYETEEVTRYINTKVLENVGNLNLDDLDKVFGNGTIQAFIDQFLGTELSKLQITTKYLNNQLTGGREYHYLNLKRKYQLNKEDGTPIIDEFIMSAE